MKFTALLHKEFRECLPWLFLASAAFLILGGFLLYVDTPYGRYAGQSWELENLHPYHCIHRSVLQPVEPVLLLASLGLGLILGIRHFWIPFFTGTWPFLLHRSSGRAWLFLAKFAAAALSFLLSLGVLWSLFYIYTGRPDVSMFLQNFRVYIEGWIFILLGLVCYLGTAFSALSQHRWYTTKIFGLAFAVLASVMVFIPEINMPFTVLVLSSLLLTAGIITTLYEREF